MKIIFLLFSGFWGSFLYAQNTVTLVQTDWSGGPDQEYFSDNPTKFSNAFQLDFTSNPGELNALYTEKSNVYQVVGFKGKILTSTVTGIMAFDTLTKKWDFLSPTLTLGYHAILRDTLYTMDGANVYAYDGTSNDYGMGKNGCMLHSSYVLAGLTSFYSLSAVGDDLYIGGRTNYSGKVLKFNKLSRIWELMGDSFSNGIMCLEEYDDRLWAGTHWYGVISYWTGLLWADRFGTQLMTITDFQIHNGRLYASGYYNTVTEGAIFEFDGSSWKEIYHGYGVNNMASLKGYLYFSVRNDGPTTSIYRYNDETSEEIYTLQGESYVDNMTVIDEKLYYGGVGSDKFASYNTLYRDGEIFYKLYVRYLNSSTFTTTNGEWGTLSYDAITPENTGIKLFTIGRESGENWYVNRFPREIKSNSIIQCSDDELRYRAVMWSTEENVSASLKEVKIQATVFLGSSDLNNDSNFKIYPTPCTGLLNIQIPEHEKGNLQLKIYDFMGKLVYAREIPNLNPNQQIDLENLANGMYFLEIKSNTSNFSKTFNRI